MAKKESTSTTVSQNGFTWKSRNSENKLVEIPLEKMSVKHIQKVCISISTHLGKNMKFASKNRNDISYLKKKIEEFEESVKDLEKKLNSANEHIAESSTQLEEVAKECINRGIDFVLPEQDRTLLPAAVVDKIKETGASYSYLTGSID